MQDSTLVELLNCLNEQEWEQLGAIVGVSASNDVIGLYSYLFKVRPFEDGEKLKKEQVYQSLFKQQQYNDQKLRDAMSALASLTKDVITQAELKANPYHQHLLQVQALRKRRAEKSYQREFKRIVKDEQVDSDLSEDALLYQYQLTQEREEYFALQMEREPDGALQDRMHHLDRFYILAKLKLTCEQLNRMHILQADYQPAMLEPILLTLRSDDQYLQHPAILLYYRVLVMLMNPGKEEYYEQLIIALTEHEGRFPTDEARNLYRYAQNYCIRQVNQGNASYFNQLLELYQKQLNNKLLLPNGVIDHTDYKNIVTVGLRLKKYKWTASFIADYKECLPETVKEAAWLYNYANYLYESGQLAKAGAVLVDQNFTDIYYNLSARHLLLKIFYDEQETDALTYQIESFRLFLMRNKTVSVANRNSNLNFLKVMKNLVALRERYHYIAQEQVKAKVKKIEDAIAQYNPLANKNWLQEQINSLSQTVLK